LERGQLRQTEGGDLGHAAFCVLAQGPELWPVANPRVK